MKKSIAKAWVKALRSGEFEQIQSRLRNSGKGRCCLGVLCDVVGIPFGLRSGIDPVVCDIEICAGDDLIPNEFAPMFGMDPEDFASMNGDLSDMNDNGATFDEIADEIEKRYLGKGGAA